MERATLLCYGLVLIAFTYSDHLWWFTTTSFSNQPKYYFIMIEDSVTHKKIISQIGEIICNFG